MAFTETPTLLCLDEWAAIFGIDPWRFNQLYAENAAYPGYPGTDACGVWFQHAWQGDKRLSREDVADAIAEAEGMLWAEVGYKAAWAFEINDEVYPTRHYDRTYNVYRDYPAIHLHMGYFYQGGIEAYDALATDEAVALDDLDGDGFDETWTVTVAAGGATNPWDIGAYYTETDRNGEAISQRWRMRPATVELDTGADQVTITGQRWQLVTPDLCLVPDAVPLRVNAAGTFVTEVDVYRRYADTNTQGQAFWSPTNEELAAVYDCTLTAHKAKLGIVKTYVANSCAVTRHPDRYVAHYVAGLAPTTSGDIDSKAWKETIAYLAAALLGDRKCCDCEEGNPKLAYMRQDRAAISEDYDKRLLTLREGAAGFGTVVGALRAWDFVNRPGVRLGKGIVGI